jgi:hypothetical protein
VATQAHVSATLIEWQVGDGDDCIDAASLASSNSESLSLPLLDVDELELPLGTRVITLALAGGSTARM